MSVVDRCDRILSHLQFVFKHKDEITVRGEQPFKQFRPPVEIAEETPESLEISLSFNENRDSKSGAEDKALRHKERSQGKNRIVFGEGKCASISMEHVPTKYYDDMFMEQGTFSLSVVDDGYKVEDTHERYGSKPIVQPRTEPSALTRMCKKRVSKTSTNPYERFAKYSGVGNPKSEFTPISIFFPMCKENPKYPIDIQVKKTATVAQTIGYCCYRFNEEGRTTHLKLDTSLYCLRVVEEDGLPDTDLPALDSGEKIGKFEFDQLCLCKGSNYASDNDDEGDAEPDLFYLRVYYQDGGSTILKLKESATIEELLQAALKKRKRLIKYGIEYVIELKNSVGVELDNTQLVKAVIADDENKDLIVIRKHTKRQDLNDADSLSSETQRSTLKSTFQFRTQSRKPTNVTVSVDETGLTITTSTRIKLTKKHKSTVIPWDRIIDARGVPGKPKGVRVGVFGTDGPVSTQYMEYFAENDSDAADFQTHVNHLRRMRPVDGYAIPRAPE